MKQQILFRRRIIISLFGATLAMLGIVRAQSNAPELVAGIPVNYDEAKVGYYTLPDPLVGMKGQIVTNIKDWETWRRPEILKWFQEQQFGKAPEVSAGFSIEVTDKGTPVFDGQALRKQITLYLVEKHRAPKINLVMYLPTGKKAPSPVLVHLGFSANSTAIDDPGILPDSVWDSNTQMRVAAAPYQQKWAFPVEEFIHAGIGVVNLYYGDIEPDFAEGMKYGVRGKLLKEGQSVLKDDEWGAISAWVWGLSRVMDYLETDKDVDAKKVAINGHSRLGKTVLYAGASDTRFSVVIPSCSGEGGAALSRRNYGETIAHLVEPSRYPYQFSCNYQHYKDDPASMKVDSHLLISLVAPRPILLITGDGDKWSDPKGEFLAAVAAEPVYRLYGKKGLDTTKLPVADEAILHDMGFLMHAGGHLTLPQDIHAMISFMKKHW